MTDTPTETPDESEGMKNLRADRDAKASEVDALRKELAFTKIGTTPTEDQQVALDAVLAGDYSDADKVAQKFQGLFGTSTPPAEPPPPDPTGETIEEAPAAPGGAILDDASGLTAAGSMAPGEMPEEDPVEAGFRDFREDLQGGRRTVDARAHVLNRLIDRGANARPGGIYDQEEFHRKLDEGGYGGPEVRIVD